MNDDEKEALQVILDECAAKLAEHFDSVRIFATKQGDGSMSNTLAFDVGRGNFYAQSGQIVEWLRVQDQYQRNWAIRKDAEENE